MEPVYMCAYLVLEKSSNSIDTRGTKMNNEFNMVINVLISC